MLEQVRQTESGWVCRDPTAGWSEENDAVGFWQAPYLYVDAGSDLWRSFVEAGTLAGADAEPPKALGLLDVVLTVMQCAEHEGGKELIAWWYAVVPVAIMNMSTRPSLSTSKQRLQELLDLAVRTDAPQFQEDWGFLQYPREGILEEIDDPEFREFLSWWYQPVWGGESR